MVYCSVDEVLQACGMDRDIVKTMSDSISLDSEVNTLITAFIAKADARIKDLLKIPHQIRKERHLGDGETIELELGPDDDPFGVWSYEPEDCVEKVYAVYDSAGRVKLPYPKDCDVITEGNASAYAGSNCTLTDEETIIKCGTYSIKATFTDAGYFAYPSGADLNKNIHPWGYIGFWFRSSDATATFTFRLYDKNGNSESKTFTVDKASVWKLVRLNIEEFTGSIDWEDEKCWEFRIYSDKTCICYFDNFNFNHGWWWTYPSGTLNYGVISNDEGEFPYNAQVWVTYGFDPFKVTVPQNIANASAKLAAILLLEYLLGCRQKESAFEISSEEQEPVPDRETLQYTIERLRQRAMEDLASYGFGGPEGMVD